MLGVIMSLFTIQPWSPHPFDIPLQVLLTSILFGWTLICRFRLVRNAITIYSAFQWVLILIFALSMTYRTLADETSFLRIYQLVTGILLSFLASIAINEKRAIRIIVLMVGTTAAISSVFAILQIFGIAAWTWEGTVYAHLIHRMPSGLENSPVKFSYSVLGICVALFACALYQWRNREEFPIPYKSIGFILSVIIFVGMVAAISRSGVLSVIFAILFAAVGFLYLRKKFLSFPMFFSAVVLILFIVLFSNSVMFNKFSAKIEKTQGDMRLTKTWLVFVPVIIDYPLGVPVATYLSTDRGFYYGSSPNIMFQRVLAQTQGLAPHNILLTTAVFFGIPAALALIAFYIVLFAQGIKFVRIFHREGKATEAAFTLILLAVSVGILPHTFFHNANIILGEMRGWFWIGAFLGFIQYTGTSVKIPKYNEQNVYHAQEDEQG